MNDPRVDKDGFCYVSGRVQLASGHVLPAVLDLNVRDGGEHYGTFVAIKGKLFDLHDKELQKRFSNQGITVFPYHYNYDPCIPVDHHIDSEPEIPNLTSKAKNSLIKAIADFETSGKIFEIVKH